MDDLAMIEIANVNLKAWNVTQLVEEVKQRLDKQKHDQDVTYE